MNKVLTLASVLLTTTALAACSSGYAPSQQITFDSSGMVVHVLGHSNAHVSRDGDLSIGGTPVAVTPAQRQLLQGYYRQARTTTTAGEAMGKQGIDMAMRGIVKAAASIFDKKASAAEKPVDVQSKKAGTALTALCANIRALDATQRAIAAQIPAFAPYAAGDELKCTISRDTPAAQDAGVPASAATTVSITIQ
ncbi:MAG TPA: DUF2884 family protein [Rhodanobacteraceae bacterium]|nr:DUF2884 family protein [Rhodanobacteraceae bacterium]